MFGTLFILHILQKSILVLGSIRCLILRIDIQSLGPLPTQSQLPERIEDLCRNEKHTCPWSHFSILFGQLQSSWLHSEEQVMLPLSLLLSESSHNVIHMIEHVIIDSDKVMQCDCMPLRHRQGPISESPQNLHHVLKNSAFILCCEEWAVITGFWILEPLTGEFLWLVGSLKQLQCRVPTCLHIHYRLYRDANCGFLTVNGLVLTTRCQRDQYSKHSPLYEGQCQNFQNMMKYVLSQLSLINLVSYPTPYRF